MNFNHVLLTGSDTISGCQLVSEFKNRIGVINDYSVFLDSRITGIYCSDLTVNTQSLVEREAEIEVLPFVTVYSSQGDFFVDSSNPLIGNLTSNFPTDISNSALFFYDAKSQQQSAIFNFTNTGEAATGLLADIVSVMPSKANSLNTLDFFLNGQKIYSGDSYLITGSNNGFFYKEASTGKLFAQPKPTGSTDLTGIYSDIHGTKFIEKNNNIFVNGMKQPEDSWLELNTGVTMIVKNKSSSLVIDGEVFQEVFL